MRRVRLFIAPLLAVLASASANASPAPSPHDAIADAVNHYRTSKGLAPLPLSASLMRVAQAHLADLEANYRRGGRCNMHSWSSR
ncbi:MAG TPA: CAP domain-containing protein, partial [Pseudomonadales bacterium]|nr:CAP domain-containing protein [Pseudomonadales bacterium]